METRRRLFLMIVVSLALVIGNVEAGWKFWKKETTTTSTTTVAPAVVNPEPPKQVPGPGAAAPAPVTGSSQNRPGSPGNANRAVAGAADPGLAIGIGSTGDGIRNNAQPHRPNPGTDVGLDIVGSRPSRPGVGGNNGQGYRDWAADLTGAGEPGRQSPRLPSQGPALPSGGQQHGPGTRPASYPGAPTGQSTGQPGARPASVPGAQPGQSSGQPNYPGTGNAGNKPSSPTGNLPQPSGGQGQAGTRPGSPTNVNPTPNRPTPLHIPGQSRPELNTGDYNGGKPQVSTLHVTLKPGVSPSTPRPVAQHQPGSPGSPGSPTGGRTWADVAGGGSRPGSPTPAPRPGGQPQPRPQGPSQHGQGRPSTGAIAAGGALAGGALAGGALAGGAATGAGSTNTGGTGSKTTTTTGKVYSSNPTYSKGNTVTDEDLEKLAEALFIKDNNNANRFITLNLQKRTTSSSPVDEAPQALLTVNPEAHQIATIQKVLSLFDNYQLDTHTNEHINAMQRQEESLLVDTFLSTNVMSAAMRFLADKGFVRKDYYDYKDTLRILWFNLFSRGEGKIGSTGFEHVFMTELKTVPTGKEVLGLHNWIYFAIEEGKRNADYLGYMDKVDLGTKAAIVKMHAKFNGHDKPVTTMFVGTSPELEMALYTVCFFTRQNQACPVSLGGTKFNIVTHKFRYRGNDLVGTAYPDI